MTTSCIFYWQFCFDVSSVNGDIFVNGGSSGGRWQNVLYRYSVAENSWTLLPVMKRPRRRCASAAVNIEIETEKEIEKQVEEEIAPADVKAVDDIVAAVGGETEGESKKAKLS